MSWKCYELRFKLKSSLHIGYSSQLGILNKTRYYIPGKTLWGAVTDKLVRIFGNKDCYKTCGEFVKKNLIFSYFFIEDDEILHPQYTKEGLKFGKLNKEEFENKYLTSHVSTAIKRDSGTAEDESLHEFELINDNVDGKEVVFVGYLFARGNEGINLGGNPILIRTEEKKCLLTQDIDLFDLIQYLQIGGEKNYGFGRLELLSNGIRQVEKIFGKYSLDPTGKILQVENNKFIALSPLLSKKNDDQFNKLKLIQGDIEPLVGREWSDKGAGKNPEFDGIALVPGSKFQTKYGVRIQITDYGRLEIV